MLARSCDQLCPITADHIGDMCTDLQVTDDQCTLMICVAPEVLPVSAHPCHLPVPISATSKPHISAYQCTSMPHISAHLSCLSVSPISATYQCCQSVPPISASQCFLSVPPISARQCCLTVPVSDA
ncbi:unnamed protein product [Staurois parvus]|uniref:Uncharacterized protein n=1 Tax=Staurois parvus TaxID=386267 RepID=A0ABN9FKF7_9NEOB|nr:unnamed protein product [Staurois parvus]